MNINSIDSTTNFKAKLIVDKKLAEKLPGIDTYRELVKNIKSADYIRIRKSSNNRYLPKNDMYVVVAEKNAVVQPNKDLPKNHKHFFGLSTKLLDKKLPKEDIQLEIMDSINHSLDNLAKKIAKYNEEFPGAIVEDINIFQK